MATVNVTRLHTATVNAKITPGLLPLPPPNGRHSGTAVRGTAVRGTRVRRTDACDRVAPGNGAVRALSLAASTVARGAR
jgi:hypothetical protein